MLTPPQTNVNGLARVFVSSSKDYYNMAVMAIIDGLDKRSRRYWPALYGEYAPPGAYLAHNLMNQGGR